MFTFYYNISVHRNCSMIFFVFVFLTTFHITRCEKPTTIDTYLGPMTGVRYTESSTRKTIYEFRKIPYAKPPLQNLRFANPKLYGKWLGTLDATKYGPSCYQNIDSLSMFSRNKDISENCLFLNIYVPNGVSKKNKLPVMVWVHGGNFNTGSSTSLNGAALACMGNVIVVTINYRLGIFGFLSTGDAQSYGNYGLLDQRLAILWVRLYVSSFGGDPKSITVFGHSSGAMSITLHTLFKKNNKMFRRAILQSGFGTSPLALSKNVPKYTKQVATFLNCSSNDSTTILKCLRNSTSEIIQNGFSEITSKIDKPVMPPVFGPRVCGKYVLDNPEILLKDTDKNVFFKSLDLLIGNVDEEGSTYVQLLQPFERKYNFDIKKGIPRRILCEQVAPLASKQFFNGSSAVSKNICDNYGQASTLSQQTYKQIDFYGDMLFYSPTKFGADAHARNSSRKTFQYLFRREIPMQIPPVLPWINGTAHGTELYYIFHFSDIFTNFPLDLKLAKTVIKYWTNFAKTGDVNGGNLPNWPEYDITNKTYAVLDVNITVQQSLYKDRMEFWLNDVPNLLKQANETSDDSTSSKKTTKRVEASTVTSGISTSSQHTTTKSPDTGTTPTGIRGTTDSRQESTTKATDNGGRQLSIKLWSIIFLILAIQYQYLL